MTPEQRMLLEDKLDLWRRYSTDGSMELRDYNRRAAEALDALLTERDAMLSALRALNGGARPSNWDDDDLDAGERDAWRQLDAAAALAGPEPATDEWLKLSPQFDPGDIA